MSDRSRELRTAFDRSFAEAIAVKPSTVDYLRLRVAGEPFAVALSEVTSLHADLRISKMPSPVRALLGIAAVRAALVPIYDLRIALGVSAIEPARWTILTGDAGFAFDGFDGHARTTARVAAEQPGERPLVVLGEHAYPLIEVASLLESIQGKETPG